jgi:predicted dienelactone hydrolase
MSKALLALWILAVVATLGILALGALLGSLWLERGSELSLPAPTGTFGVGRTVSRWSDDEALDGLAPTPGTRRELLVWVWYPSEPGPSAATDEYVPAELRVADERIPKPPFPFRLLTRDFSKVRSHSIRNPELSPKQRTYPVVVLRAGASAGVLNYSTLAEDLASHGYVVVGFDAPYRTGLVVFPDGRVIARTEENNPERCFGQPHARYGDPSVEACASRLLAAWTADIGFVLSRLEQLNAADASSRFTGRLDMTRVGVFGHSFGGAAAALFCHEDSRCKAGIDIDGAPHGSVIQSGLRQPFLFLLSDHGGETDPESQRILANIQSLYDHLPADTRLRVTIRGANHFVFSDDGALLKSRFVRGALRLFGKLGIDGDRQLAVTAHCLRSFFDAHLKQGGASRPEIPSSLYPELQVVD